MADIPRVYIDVDAEIEWVRHIERVAVPDTPTSGHINVGFNGTDLTWVDDAGNVYTATGGSTFDDSAFQIYDNADPTKTFQFQASGITAGQNRVYTVPDANTTLVGTDTTQTLTNKSIVASQITAGTFSAGAYIFEHATATGVPLSVRSTDDSATNPAFRILDSASGVRAYQNYDGTTVLGRTTGGTYNGNILLEITDQFPTLYFRGGTTTKFRIYSDANDGLTRVFLRGSFIDFLSDAGATKARFDLGNGFLYLGALTGNGAANAYKEDGGTTTIITALEIGHNSTGTPAANFGVDAIWSAESSTTASTSQARIRSYWTVATHASRTARAVWSAYDTAERDCISIEASGSEAMVGFFGTAPIVKPTVTGSRGGNAALADLLTELAALGLIVDSSSA